jgi:hypothetical protein
MADENPNVFESVIRDFSSMNQEDIRNAQTDQDFNSLIDKLQNTLGGLRSDDNSPNGPKAQALVDLGRRRPEWDWAVGETPD